LDDDRHRHRTNLGRRAAGAFTVDVAPGYIGACGFTVVPGVWKVIDGLAIKARSLGKDHLELAAALGTLGVVRRRQGDAIEAEQLSGRALARYYTGASSTVGT
jgi:hypothetical protein